MVKMMMMMTTTMVTKMLGKFGTLFPKMSISVHCCDSSTQYSTCCFS